MAESTKEGSSPLGRLVGVTIGVAFMAGDMVDGGIAAAWRVNQRAWNTAALVTEPLRKSLEGSGVAEMVQRPVQAMLVRSEATLTELEARGRTGLVLGDGAVAETVTSIIEAVLTYLKSNPDVRTLIEAQVDWLVPMLSNHPSVRALVREQVAAVLPALADDPAVQALIRAQAGQYIQYLTDNADDVQTLIRAQGDTYIDYLNLHPTSVQNLIQGQSLSLAGQVRDEVRERTVTADGLVDLVVRNVLRLKPREELPPPPEAVQRRAETAHLPSDFIRERTNGNA